MRIFSCFLFIFIIKQQKCNDQIHFVSGESGKNTDTKKMSLAFASQGQKKSNIVFCEDFARRFAQERENGERAADEAQCVKNDEHDACEPYRVEEDLRDER